MSAIYDNVSAKNALIDNRLQQEHMQNQMPKAVWEFSVKLVFI